jgi:hypothetical protein
MYSWGVFSDSANSTPVFAFLPPKGLRMNRILLAAVALIALGYAVYAVRLKPGSNESAGNIPTPSEATVMSPASSSDPNSAPAAGAPPVPAPAPVAAPQAPAQKKATEAVTAPLASSPKAEKAHHASHSKKPAKPH